MDGWMDGWIDTQIKEDIVHSLGVLYRPNSARKTVVAPAHLQLFHSWYQLCLAKDKATQGRQHF